VSAGVIAFAVESRRKNCRGNEREELFLARAVQDGRSGFALVEIGPALRHVIFVISRQRYPGVVDVPSDRP
jgi:hypothetical protein